MSTSVQPKIHRYQLGVAALGIAALAASAYGLVANRQQFFFSYLWSWLFWMGLSVGSFLIVMIHHLTGGRWGYPTRRFHEAAFMAFPLMLLLFSPLLFGVRELYPWARPEEVLAEKVLQHRQAYMAFWPYALRAGVVLVFLVCLAAGLRGCSLKQDGTTDAAPTRRARFLSGPGLVITGLLLTFASVDWIMALEKRWFSSIFAVLLMGGQVMVAFAFSILMLTFCRRSDPLNQVVEPTHYHQLGNLLFTFVLFWAYVSFGQLLIIYSGDLPPETDWYLHRISGGWKYLVIGLGVFHFFVPFFLLLFRALKLRLRPLAMIAALVFVANAVHTFWLVTPSLHKNGITLSWLDLTTPIGIGGLWLTVFLWRLKSAALVPRQDPGLQFAFKYGA